jgi:hypothetical protein
VIIKWPTELVSDLARRRSVLVLGSGISRASKNVSGDHPKIWKDLLLAGVVHLTCPEGVKTEIRKLITKRDYLTACEVIKNEMGNSQFHDFMRAEFLVPAFDAAPIHDSIIKLDSRVTATPNFAKIYETRINHQQGASVAVKHYYDNDLAEVIRGTSRVIIKVHGTVDKPSEMIFTRSEYAIARSKHRSFYMIVESLVMTHTFLFLGCGLDDPDIRLILEDYAFQHGFGKPHFFVLPKDQIHKHIKPKIESSLNIKILEYDPHSNHAQLKDAIDELIVLVDAERQVLQTNSQW